MKFRYSIIKSFVSVYYLLCFCYDKIETVTNLKNKFNITWMIKDDLIFDKTSIEDFCP